jgi:ELWxxDGT repeat protein
LFSALESLAHNNKKQQLATSPLVAQCSTWNNRCAGWHRGAGEELWRSDGTPEGTALVKDIQAGSGSGMNTFLAHPVDINGTLFLPPTTASMAVNFGRATALRLRHRSTRRSLNLSRRWK